MPLAGASLRMLRTQQAWGVTSIAMAMGVSRLTHSDTATIMPMTRRIKDPVIVLKNKPAAALLPAIYFDLEERASVVLPAGNPKPFLGS